MNNIIGFYHEYEEYDCFSNWYQSDFEYAGKHYISTEQYMMYQKMMQFRAYDIADEILAETDQGKIKHLRRTKLDDFDPDLWDKTKYTIVKRGIRAKFLQNPDIAEILYLYQKTNKKQQFILNLSSMNIKYKITKQYSFECCFLYAGVSRHTEVKFVA